MRRALPYLAMLLFFVAVMVGWFLFDGWRVDRCHQIGAEGKHIDRAVVCVTPDGRIVEP